MFRLDYVIKKENYAVIRESEWYRKQRTAHHAMTAPLDDVRGDMISYVGKITDCTTDRIVEQLTYRKEED